MSRELLQQALDALESPMIKTHSVLREAIRAHLAAQPAPAAVPVAWMLDTTDGKLFRATDSKHNGDWLPLYTAPPAAADCDDCAEHASLKDSYAQLLAENMRLGATLASPPAPVPVPLTDEQIDSMWRQPMSADWEHREFARAIEAHHGIVASPEKMP